MNAKSVFNVATIGIITDSNDSINFIQSTFGISEQTLSNYFKMLHKRYLDWYHFSIHISPNVLDQVQICRPSTPWQDLNLLLFKPVLG